MVIQYWTTILAPRTTYLIKQCIFFLNAMNTFIVCITLLCRWTRKCSNWSSKKDPYQYQRHLKFDFYPAVHVHSFSIVLIPLGEWVVPKPAKWYNLSSDSWVLPQASSSRTSPKPFSYVASMRHPIQMLISFNAYFCCLYHWGCPKMYTVQEFVIIDKDRKAEWMVNHHLPFHTQLSLYPCRPYSVHISVDAAWIQSEIQDSDLEMLILIHTKLRIAPVQDGGQ